ncbi:hypothetical protein Tco_1103294 [Tanacetum coccineum]
MQALADLVRALTNAYSVWKDARSSELTNCMTLETCRSFKSLKTNRSPESFDSRDTIELYLSGRCRSFLALEDDPTSSGRLLMEEDMIPSVANVREGDGEDVFGYRKTYSSQPGKTTSHLPSWVQMLERLAVYEPLRIFRSFFHVKSIVYTGHSCIKYLFAKMDAKAKESAVILTFVFLASCFTHSQSLLTRGIRTGGPLWCQIHSQEIISIQDSIGPTIYIRMPHDCVNHVVDLCQTSRNKISQRDEMPQNSIPPILSKSLTSGALMSYGAVSVFLDCVGSSILSFLTRAFTSSASSWEFRTDNQEKDEKQSQNNKTGLGMEKTVKDKAITLIAKDRKRQSQVNSTNLTSQKRRHVIEEYMVASSTHYDGAGNWPISIFEDCEGTKWAINQMTTSPILCATG